MSTDHADSDLLDSVNEDLKLVAKEIEDLQRSVDYRTKVTSTIAYNVSLNNLKKFNGYAIWKMIFIIGVSIA